MVHHHSPYLYNYSTPHHQYNKKNVKKIVGYNPADLDLHGVTQEFRGAGIDALSMEKYIFLSILVLLLSLFIVFYHLLFIIFDDLEI